MKSFYILFLLIGYASLGQNIDYNVKKGFVANGYDVVAYFNHHAVEGNKQFSTQFDGVKYKFSSQENLSAFLKNPKKYIPQYGGYCAYAIGTKSEKVSINPETFEIKDGRLYLFYNAWGTNTLELWKKENETKLQQQADINWERIKFKK
jgi:YHS domain-containing protein